MRYEYFPVERAEINFSKCHRFDYTETTEMFSN